MSVQALSYFANAAVLAAQSLSAMPPVLLANAAGTETVIVLLKNGTSVPVYNVLGSSLVTPYGLTITLPTTGANSNSTTVTMGNTAGLAVGMLVVGFGIAANTFITAIVANTSITISIAATTTSAQTLQFGSLPAYDGSIYRDDMSASFTGAPDFQIPAGGVVSIPVSTTIPKSDRVNHVAPRPVPKLRNRRVYFRFDSTGVALGTRSFWDDQVIGEGDAIPVFSK